MITYLLLYILPITTRFTLTDEIELGRIALSLVPFVVVFPSTFLPLIVKNEEREHVLRHTCYALSFTVSVGTSIRWDVVTTSYTHEEWPLHLILFCSIGSATLWWFVVSHVIENVYGILFTHHGDVTVLPLTLIAVATFVQDVPDEAFQFSRCIVFYVPVVVAWATLHFVAFNGFAVSKTTTYTTEGFSFLALSGLVVAVAHLTLIELRAGPISFLVLPVVASLLSQVTTRSTHPPVLRPCRLLGMWSVQVGFCVLFGLLLMRRFDSTRLVLLCVVVGMSVVMTVPVLCGRSWVVPSVMYATLMTVSYMNADNHILPDVRVFDVVCIASQFFIVFQVTHLIAPPTESQLFPPAAPPLSEDFTPQTNVTPCSITAFLRMLDRVPIPHCRMHGETTVSVMMKDRSDSCPPELAGVWWTKGSTFPTQLVTVHRHVWTKDDNGVFKSTFTLRRGARSATLAGVLNLLGQALCVTQVQWCHNERWVRTPGWVFPILRLLPDTYWLYHVREDEMLRLVFDQNGKIVWQYRMLRIVRGDENKTKFYNDFMRMHGGMPCLLT